MANRNTVQGTLNWSAAFILNRPSTGVAGNFQEPGLTNANLLMSTILAPPFAWQWNRATAAFSTAANQSDYVVNIPNFGWLEKVTVSFNGDIKEIEISSVLTSSANTGRPFKICPLFDDNNGNITFRLMFTPDQNYTVILTYQQAPNFLTSLFGSSLGNITSIAAPTDGVTTVYTASGGFTGSAGNALDNQYLFVSSSLNPANNGLYLCTASGPTTISLQNPSGILQAGAGGIIQIAKTWAPIPDKYNFLYERGMLAHLHAMYDSATYAMELQLFFRQLVGCSEGLSDTAKAIFLEDRLSQIRTEAAAQAASTASPKRGQ